MLWQTGFTFKQFVVEGKTKNDISYKYASCLIDNESGPKVSNFYYLIILTNS